MLLPSKSSFLRSGRPWHTGRRCTLVHLLTCRQQAGRAPEGQGRRLLRTKEDCHAAIVGREEERQGGQEDSDGSGGLWLLNVAHPDAWLRFSLSVFLTVVITSAWWIIGTGFFADHRWWHWEDGNTAEMFSLRLSAASDTFF